MLSGVLMSTWQQPPCSKVWELLRRVLFAVLVQRFPGRKRVPKIREAAYRRALELIRRAVGALAHQNEVSTLIEPERRIIHASDRQVPVRVDPLQRYSTPG